MIIPALLWLLALGAIQCHPQRQNFKLPQLRLSPPEEINSLEHHLPQERSIEVNSQNNIELTIKEVEEILSADLSLPRLTRGEILDILENITGQDVKMDNQNRSAKAIMVVMPYTPSNDKNMEELYTKAPVTQMIGLDSTKSKDQGNNSKVKSRRRKPVIAHDFPASTTTAKPSTTIKWRFEEKSTTPRPKQKAQPIETSTYHPKRPLRRRTTTQHPNHRYSEHQEMEVTTRRGTFVPSDGIRIVESPKLVPTDLSVDENVRQEVVLKQTFPVYDSLALGSTTKKAFSVKFTTPVPIADSINLPHSFRNLVKDLDLDAALAQNQTENPIPASDEDKKRLQELLASIGVVQELTTTTTTAAPDVGKIAESISPEMRDLLMSFGLIADPKKPAAAPSSKYYPEKAEVKPESYVGFKPLPDEGPSADDMDALLASFGLGRNSRKQKAINTKSEQYNLDMIPDHLKSVVSDLGLAQSQRQEKKISSSSGKQHVFNPDTSENATDEELKKLAKLLNMIKQLEQLNGTASDDDLKKIDVDGLKDLVNSLNGNEESLVPLDQKDNAPDPVTFDKGLNKNEVKRQENTTTASTTTLTEASTNTPNLADLEASFGGQVQVSTEGSPPESTTTNTRTGFYYLVDWNTFLDIDDQKGKRVNLRFQPTIGDPKRFLSVTVP